VAIHAATPTPAAQTQAPTQVPQSLKPPAPVALSPEVIAADRRAAAEGRALASRGKYDEALSGLQAGSDTTPGGEATLELGLLLRYLGRQDEASKAFNIVALQPLDHDSALAILRAARTARALGLFRRANSLFQEAAKLATSEPAEQPAAAAPAAAPAAAAPAVGAPAAAAPATAAAGAAAADAPPPETGPAVLAAVQAYWGELFLEKYNTPEAVDAFTTALKADPKAIAAHLGLARALLDENASASADSARAALALDESSVGARLILAELALDERKLSDARQEIDKALAVNPGSLEALALSAAVAHLQDRRPDFDSIVSKALAINPRYGDIYRVPGSQVAAHYRFDEAVALTQKGLEIQPDYPRALADLGMHLLRTGDEPGARAALEKAFKLDAYDVVTYNLLAMLDTLDKFDTIADGDIVLRLHPDEVEIMRGPSLALAHKALATLSKQYGFTPKGPILIEAFPKHDDFAVRNLGLPGMIGALGACFGRVVTLDSPRARTTPGSFNWSATLWHELAHVVTLQMSNQRVPRWLTEGISMFEERRAQPGWGREFEFEFLNALAQGQQIKLSELNSGFMTARTIALAYHESSLLVEHIVETYGDAGLQRMLRAYGEGKDTDEVVKQVLNTDMDGLQVSFDQFVERRFGKAITALKPLKATPPAGDNIDVATIKTFADENSENYAVQLQAGQALMFKKDFPAAQAVLERAVGLVPQTMGDASARALLANVLEKKGDRERAMQELDTLLADSSTALEAARQLVTLATAADDDTRQRTAVDRIVALDPFDAGAHATLGRLALAQQDATVALRELQVALKLGSPDQAAVHTDMAEAYMLKGQTAQVREHVIAALEIAPRFERAQELLLKVVDAPRR
jgi:tetratricopeptide (TPR) repeat protein